MTPNEIRQLVHAVYTAVNTQDAAQFDRLFAPNIIRHAMNEVGIAPAKAALIGAYTSRPDRHFMVEDVIVEGDRAALRVSVHEPEHRLGTPIPIILEIVAFENLD